MRTLLLVLLLTGCAATKPPEVRYVTQAVEKVVVPTEPAWSSQELPAGTSLNDIFTRTLADLQSAIGYIDQLKATFKPFSK